MSGMDEIMNKAKEALGDEKTSDAILDKAAELAKEKFRGHEQQIDDFRQKADDALGGKSDAGANRTESSTQTPGQEPPSPEPTPGQEAPSQPGQTDRGTGGAPDESPTVPQHPDAGTAPAPRGPGGGTTPANPSEVPGQDSPGTAPGQGMPGGLPDDASRPGADDAPQSPGDAPAPRPGGAPADEGPTGVPAPGNRQPSTDRPADAPGTSSSAL